jgi:DHA2 family multidrug resistance protein
MSFDDAAIGRMYQSIGLPFLFVSVTAVAYVGLGPDESNQASALMNMSRNLGGTFGISLVQTLLLRREQFHQARMVETLNPLHHGYQNWMQIATKALVGHGEAAAQAGHTATGLLYRAMTKQAAMLSYLDAFHLLAIIVFCVAPLVLLMKAPGMEAPPPDVAA